MKYRDSSGMVGHREWSHTGIVRLDRLRTEWMPSSLSTFSCYHISNIMVRMSQLTSLTCCRTFFLLFIRAQYESEPQVSMLYCNSICWITRLRCSCTIKLLHVLCCCHSVLQLGRSLFFFVSAFFPALLVFHY